MSAKTVNVTMAVPFEKNGDTVTCVELRKPCAGDLRGLTLTEVVSMDFTSCGTLLTRISNLNERDVLNLEPENLTPLLIEIANFFINTDK
jgi:hypothetical protein